MNCYFCTGPIDDKVEWHHPDREDRDLVVPAHPECHRRYHLEVGHFEYWGGLSATSGRPGYEICIEKWPGFHHMGGLARAHTADRDSNGRFC